MWTKGHCAWNLQQPVLEEVLARDDTVYLVGIFGNQPECYHLFDKLIALTISAHEYEWRLRDRPRREVGDDDKNMEDRLRTYLIHAQRFADAGAEPIDASGSTAETVDAILELVGHAK